jgi:2-polyprenyl-3-methyl-5-hydroxy-6-metoxy-1,4-benzoquinol methylase
LDPTVQLIEDLTDRVLGRTEGVTLVMSAASQSEFLQHFGALQMNADVAQMPQPAGRAAFVKRLVLKLAGFAFVRQEAANRAMVGALAAVRQDISAAHAQMDHAAKLAIVAHAERESENESHSRRQAEQHRQTLRSLSEFDRDAAADREVIASMRADLDLLAASVADLTVALHLERSRRQVVDRRLAQLERPSMTAKTSPSSEDVPPGPSVLLELYERFEASFRPADADLSARFSEYLDDIRNIADDSHVTLDVGCGRGDFVSLLTRAGIRCQGIDLNPDAIAAGQSQGLNVAYGDAILYLHALKAESLSAVTAFHVAEHMEADDLITFIDEAVRALKPGGLLILETPNPTNLVVGASSFYHDPTHHRPLTPAYLAFLLQDRGLISVETRFLHPTEDFDLAKGAFHGPGQAGLSALIDDVRWALKGPQDFAVLGFRPGRGS